VNYSGRGCEIFFCEDEVAEDVEEHLHGALENIPGNRVAGPDTLLRVIKELAGTRRVMARKKGHESAHADRRSRLNL
jgi:hypothetical protein